jgi:hypothetical protein
LKKFILTVSFCTGYWRYRHKIYTVFVNRRMEEKNRTSGTDQNRQQDTVVHRAAAKGGDLPDSPHDAERLKNEEFTIDLPDVKDIPGQEFVHTPPLGILADTTISSADEEGEGLFDDAGLDDEDEFIPGTEADVSPEERQALQGADNYMFGEDDNQLRRASMDNTDFEGEALNEQSFGAERSGADLDIPEAVDETRTDALGQGDEENKYYSLGSDDNDTITEGTP